LLFAAKFGHVDCVKYLAERGADVKAKKDNGKVSSCLNHANSYSFCSCISFIFGLSVRPL